MDVSKVIPAFFVSVMCWMTVWEIWGKGKNIKRNCICLDKDVNSSKVKRRNRQDMQ